MANKRAVVFFSALVATLGIGAVVAESQHKAANSPLLFSTFTLISSGSLVPADLRGPSDIINASGTDIGTGATVQAAYTVKRGSYDLNGNVVLAVFSSGSSAAIATQSLGVAVTASQPTVSNTISAQINDTMAAGNITAALVLEDSTGTSVGSATSGILGQIQAVVKPTFSAQFSMN